MAKVALILGESGSGKTASARTLPPKHTAIIQPEQKELPWEGSESQYRRFNKKTGKGNLFITDKTSGFAKYLQYINDERPEIRFIVMDDNQYLSLFTFINRINEKSFDKFNDIAVNMVELVRFCKKLRPNLQIFILQHVESGETVEGEKVIQAKTMGKFVKEKVTYEGLFTTVMLADKEEDEHGELEYFLWTRKGNSTVKTPMGMFADKKIDNDLYAVAKRVHEYYNKAKSEETTEETE
jgi:hypothetical protein